MSVWTDGTAREFPTRRAAPARYFSSIVLAVEERRVRVHEEELRAGGVGVAGAGHGEHAALVAAGVELLLELVARAAGAGAGGVAALDHEAGDDAVEDDALVVPVARQEHEAVDVLRRVLRVQLQFDRTRGGVDLRGVSLVRVDRHRRGGVVALGHVRVLRLRFRS
jgi:hypothetical protein